METETYCSKSELNRVLAFNDGKDAESGRFRKLESMPEKEWQALVAAVPEKDLRVFLGKVSENRYRKILESLPEVFTVWGANERQDQEQHFDIGYLMSSGEIRLDDIKSAKPENRHGFDTRYVIRQPVVSFVMSLPKSILKPYGLVVEQYDETGKPSGKFMRFRWKDILPEFDIVFTEKTADGKPYWLFDPKAAIDSGLYPESVEPDVPVQ